MGLVSVVTAVSAVLVHSDRPVKLLNDHIANYTSWHVKDRLALYHEAPQWSIGEGRRVAIVDIGLPQQDAVFGCSRSGDTFKVAFEIDASKPGEPKLTKPPHDNCTVPVSELFERPMIANHLTKSLIYGFWVPSDDLPMGAAVAQGAQVISIVFRRRLYVYATDRHHTSAPVRPEVIDPVMAADYLAGLVRAATWLVDHARTQRICSVQVSAVDGLGVSPQWYADVSAQDYERWTSIMAELKHAGVWVSAPTGNQPVKNESNGYNWPASDPNVIGVGCWSEGLGGIYRQRGPGLDLIVRSMEDHPPSSYCNTLAVALSVTARDMCERLCNFKLCTASFILFAMQYTARIKQDSRSSLHYYVVTNSRLLNYLNSTASCDDALSLHHNRTATVKRLPFRSSYFASAPFQGVRDQIELRHHKPTVL